MTGPQGMGPLRPITALTEATGGDAIGDDGYMKFHYFTNNGTFVRGSITSVDLYALGAGGSAGDGVVGTYYDAGGAGGVVRELDDVTISADISVTVGTAAAYANVSNNGTDGPNGGDTIIGSLLTATGGNGGGVNGARIGGNNADFLGSGYAGGANNNSGAGAGAGGDGQQAAFNSTGGIGKISRMTGDRRGGGGAGGGNQGSANVGGDGGGGGYGVAGTDQYGGGGGNGRKGGSGLAIIAHVAINAPTIAAGPPTWVGAGNPGNSTIDKPSGLAVGDLLLLHCIAGSGTAPVPSSGNFRLLYGRYDGNNVIYYKIVDGSEPSSWTPGGLGISSFVCYRTYAFRGVNARHKLDADVVASGTHTNPGQTTVHANTMAVYLVGYYGATTGNLGSISNGFTAGVFETTFGSMGVAYKLITSPGAIGSTSCSSVHGSSSSTMLCLRSN